MNNRERTKKIEHMHLYIAIRRNKENSDGQEICFREVIRNEVTSLDALEVRVKSIPGTWRIYKTVNCRDMERARILLLMKLIENPDLAYKVDTIWKTCLLQPKCRKEHKLLWDIDGKIVDKHMIETIFSSRDVDIKECIKTPNGYNVITDVCDTRLFDKTHLIKTFLLEDFSFSRDGVKFIKRFTIEPQKTPITI